LSEQERAAFAAGVQEIAVAVDGTLPEHTATERFLDLLLSANPRLRLDWPVWLPWDLAEFYRLDPK
jgi:hypothetical protein